MSARRELLVEWIDRRTREIVATPRMWGAAEAVEMQVLQLLEMRVFALRPELERENPRLVMDAYVAFLRDRFPTSAPAPLCSLVGGAPDAALFRETLSDFQEFIARKVLKENPFEHSLLAVKLTFHPGRLPNAAAFTGYYEDFRRATRAAVRSTEVGAGRLTRELERATDFTLEDAEVTPPNGAPGEVLLRLGQGTGQQDFDADGRVRDALSTIVTIAEWAATPAPIDALPVDDVQQRTKAAVQALRILPRRGIRTVSLGGRLIARSRPVELSTEHEKRFLAVVGAEAAVETFDTKEEIRAIDLDRGLLLLGKARVHCYVRPDQLSEITAVGIQARIRGQLYRPIGSRPFVIVESIQTEERAAGDE
jgi:hypothetical protein